MEVTILDEKKNRIEFILDGETHTLCNTLRGALLHDDNVKYAGYYTSHPLVGKPHFIIETNTGVAPKKALQDSIKSTLKELDAVKKDAKQIK